MDKINILIVEDNWDDGALIKLFLEKAGMSFHVDHVASKNDFVESISKNRYDVILCDHSLPAFSSLEAIKLAREADRYVPFIIISGSMPEEKVVEMMKEGANDYILKSNLLRLPHAIEKAIEYNKMKRLINH